jgi:hypothetical protein
MGGLRSPEVQLFINAIGYGATTIERLAARGAPLHIKLERRPLAQAASLIVRVVDSITKLPIPSAQVEIPGARQIERTDDALKFHNLLAGTCTMMITAPGYVPQWFPELRLVSGGLADLGVIQLERVGSVLFQIQAQGSTIIENQLKYDLNAIQGQRPANQKPGREVTNGKPYFRFPGLTPGRYGLTVTQGELVAFSEFLIEPGLTTNLSLTLRPR